MAIEIKPPKQTSQAPIVTQDILVDRPWISWVLMFLFWTLLSATFPITDYIKALAYPDKVQFNLIQSLATSFPAFYLWFAFTPLVFWFGRKFSIGRDKKLVQNLLIHLFLSYVVVAVYLMITSIHVVFLLHESKAKYTFWAHYFDRIYMIGHFEVIIYWAILGVGMSLGYYKKYREHAREASQLLLRSTKLEAQLARAELDALKMQLHPHFLFNTLHAISALMEDSPKRARSVIARLGELLRATLDISDQQTITLEEEIVLTKLYLEIEQERFRDKLSVNIDVSNEELSCQVPSLILQPLIENAIKHGITDEERAAVIDIKVIRKKNNRIHLYVQDNGPGFSENDAMELQDGIGLSNTKARLEQLYGDDHEFIASNSKEGGARVEISIPCDKSSNTNESE